MEIFYEVLPSFDFSLTIALSYLTYAAPATTNSVLSSSEAKGIIKNQYIVILNKDVGSSNSLHKVLLNNMVEGITDL